ncbi:TetR/AcrR family transcriptional regulator [Nitrosospira multiformis]|uniref:TetR/AcrR family transcriptional regulator n=1 Tax=Nitrosospira multiformis TaxID=1231 RepID=UPI00089C68DA|nr:TetR/AcrR family transcriptional regulator [Nitrosospira multiformis]SEA00335.1 transcriptional regulator, TetR family [Nitrosospira multiformis]
MVTADQIVNTAVELGEQKSWEAVRLHDVAAALGITLNDVHAHFREKEDIVEAWFERADSAMLRIARAPDFSFLTPRQRLHRLIMAWLASLYPYRKATRQMIYGKLEPGHLHLQISGLMRVSRTVQWMREAAGRDATYLRRALEESALTSIYLATFAHWMNDSSSGSSRTSRFLDGCLSVGENLDRMLFFHRRGGERTGSGEAPQGT